MERRGKFQRGSYKHTHTQKETGMDGRNEMKEIRSKGKMESKGRHRHSEGRDSEWR